LARIAGDYAAMGDDERLQFTQQLRDARRKGSGVRAVRKEKENGEVSETSEVEKVSVSGQESVESATTEGA
jgi:hypothetical protein